MDESSVKFSPEHKNGHVAILRGWKRRQFLQIERRNPLKRRRAAVTLMAFVSDNEEINKELPQIIVGAEHHIQAWMSPLLMNGRTDNVLVLRRKSAWLRSDNVVSIIRALGKTLEPFLDRFRFILMMDAAPIHIAKKVVQACTRYCIYPLYIPASMTGLLQPLDTHVFAIYKNLVRRRHQDAMVKSEAGDVSTYAFLEILISAIVEVITGRSWRNAFLHTGFVGRQQALSTSLKDKLGLQAPPNLAPILPTLHELEVIYPKGTEPPVDCLFELFMPPKMRKRILPESFTWSGPPVNPANPWKGRLRSSSALLVDSQQVLEDSFFADSPAPSGAGHSLTHTACPRLISSLSLPAPGTLPKARRLLPPQPLPRRHPARP